MQLSIEAAGDVLKAIGALLVRKRLGESLPLGALDAIADIESLRLVEQAAKAGAGDGLGGSPRALPLGGEG